jgi:elongation factor G
MPVAFRELAAEDPSLRIEHDPGTGQVVLWTTGPAHLDLILAGSRARYNVDVEKVPVKVPMKETAITKAQAQGRHVKQSGGHGQFAVVHLTMEPLPRGTGNEFHEVVVGGAVPRQFIQSVEKGAHMQLDKGLLAGWPVVDVKVTLHDGKAHSVDSSDMAFQTAAALALQGDGLAATMGLLEPIDAVLVTVDDDYLGAVMTDVSTRRGQIVGSEPAEGEEGRSALTALIPQLELIDYAIALRSLAHGTGTFTRELSRVRDAPGAASPRSTWPRRQARLKRLTAYKEGLSRARPPETGSDILEQGRQSLGLGDDRQEVGVASPTGHDVLVQVGLPPRPRRPHPGSCRC